MVNMVHIISTLCIRRIFLAQKSMRINYKYHARSLLRWIINKIRTVRRSFAKSFSVACSRFLHLFLLSRQFPSTQLARIDSLTHLSAWIDCESWALSITSTTASKTTKMLRQMRCAVRLLRLRWMLTRSLRIMSKFYDRQWRQFPINEFYDLGNEMTNIYFAICALGMDAFELWASLKQFRWEFPCVRSQRMFVVFFLRI